MKPPEVNEEGDDAEISGNILGDFAKAVNEGDHDSEVLTALKFFQHAADSVDERSPWMVAMSAAHRCEDSGDWKGAEAAYLRALESEPGSPGNGYQVYSHLSSLFSLQGLHEKALDAASISTEFARKFDFKITLTEALLKQTALLLYFHEYDKARGLIDEAATLPGEERVNDLLRALVMLERTDYFLCQDMMQEVQSCLENTWPVLEPRDKQFLFAGFQVALARWWGITAMVRSKNADNAGSVVAWRESVGRRRIVAQAQQLEGPYKFNNLAKALSELGRAQRAANEPLAIYSFRESRSIRESISLPPLDE